MNVREAKNFLVNQTAQQAAIDRVPLSDLEKRMMYFSESDETCQDPIALNEEFEAQYISDEYEPKIARLLKHAYSRIKKENPDEKGTWDQTIRELKKGEFWFSGASVRRASIQPEASSRKLELESLSLSLSQ